MMMPSPIQIVVKHPTHGRVICPRKLSCHLCNSQSSDSGRCARAVTLCVLVNIISGLFGRTFALPPNLFVLVGSKLMFSHSVQVEIYLLFQLKFHISYIKHCVVHGKLLCIFIFFSHVCNTPEYKTMYQTYMKQWLQLQFHIYNYIFQFFSFQKSERIFMAYISGVCVVLNFNINLMSILPFFKVLVFSEFP